MHVLIDLLTFRLSHFVQLLYGSDTIATLSRGLLRVY